MSYKDLKSYQQATIIYDFTVNFCDLHIDKKSRTHDQMVQAARSGKQNLAEGSAERAEKNELYLLGIARASFQELLEDYEDFLRQKGLKQWNKDSPEAAAVRGLAYGTDRADRMDVSDRTNGAGRADKSYIGKPEDAANAALCLIHQTNFLLDRQIKVLEEKFIKNGGYAERLRKARDEEKKRRLIGSFYDPHPKDWREVLAEVHRTKEGRKGE